MADSGLTIQVDQTDALNLTGRTGRHQVLQALANHLDGLKGGSRRFNALRVWADGATPRPARAVVKFATSSGVVGATINGVAVTVTWATSDANSGTLFAAAVNASTNALVQYLVQACNIAGTVALASVAAGDFVEFYVAGVGTFRFTAKNGGALDAAEFDMSGTDTADAASFVTQFNNRPVLNQYFIAESTSGTVTIRQLSGTTVLATMGKSAATFTLTALAAGAETLVSSLVPGVVGNCQSIAASGTNVTINGSLTRLASGTGNNVTPQLVL